MLCYVSPVVIALKSLNIVHLTSNICVAGQLTSRHVCASLCMLFEFSLNERSISGGLKMKCSLNAQKHTFMLYSEHNVYFNTLN